MLEAGLDPQRVENVIAGMEAQLGAGAATCTASVIPGNPAVSVRPSVDGDDTWAPRVQPVRTVSASTVESVIAAKAQIQPAALSAARRSLQPADAPYGAGVVGRPRSRQSSSAPPPVGSVESPRNASASSYGANGQTALLGAGPPAQRAPSAPQLSSSRSASTSISVSAAEAEAKINLARMQQQMQAQTLQLQVLQQSLHVQQERAQGEWLIDRQ